MATTTIFRDVVIKEKHLGRTFVSALENAVNKSTKQVDLKCSYEEVKGEKIRNIFKEER